jgi:hypothetical protein
VVNPADAGVAQVDVALPQHAAQGQGQQPLRLWVGTTTVTSGSTDQSQPLAERARRRPEPHPQVECEGPGGRGGLGTRRLARAPLADDFNNCLAPMEQGLGEFLHDSWSV